MRDCARAALYATANQVRGDASAATHSSVTTFKLANIAKPLVRAAERYFARVDGALAPRSRLVEHVLGALCAVLGTGQSNMPELVDANPVLDARAALTSAACEIRLHPEVEGSAASKSPLPVDDFDVRETLKCVDLLTNTTEYHCV